MQNNEQDDGIPRCKECGMPLLEPQKDRIDKGMCWKCWGRCHD
jgi:hypothetical protein